MRLVSRLRSTVTVCLVLFASAAVSAQNIATRPAAGFSLGEDATYLKPGFGGAVSAFFPLSLRPLGGRLEAGAALDYSWTQALHVERSFSLVALGPSIAWKMPLLGSLSLRVEGSGGVYLAAEHSEFDNAPEIAPWFGSDLLLDLWTGPRMHIQLGPRFRYLGGMTATVGASAGVAWSFGEEANAYVRSDPSTVRPSPLLSRKGAGNLSVPEVDLQSVFPVLFAWYDDNAIGTVLVQNRGKKTVTGITASLFAPRYMDNPKFSPPVASLAPGQSIEIPIYALFTNKILDESEGSKVSATIALDYSVDGKVQRIDLVRTLELRDRNALIWDDDRKAAAFVTAKDPAVLGFAKLSVSSVKNPYLDRGLTAALAIHEALRLYGLSYVVDPGSPFTLASTGVATDFVQFPRQTLEFKAGDCDDLSVLYCALLESVGVDTAFITVPGHIYIAAALSISPDEAQRRYSRSSDFIFEAGRAWLPLEVTHLGGTFFEAWKKGAEQWAEASRKGEAMLFPVKDAWNVFRPVAFPGSADVPPPRGDRIAGASNPILSSYVEREIAARISRDQLNPASTNPAMLNRLGVLHAQWGKVDIAADYFNRSLKIKAAVPALINLGNLRLLANDPLKAGSYYNQAVELDPRNPNAVLCLARAANLAADYAGALKAWQRLKVLSPDLAEKNAYLAARGDDAARAGAGDAASSIVWEE